MPRRPRTATARSATIVGLYVGAAAVAAAAPFARLPGAGATLVAVVALVAAFVVGQQLVWYPRWAQVGGLLAAAVFVVCGGLAAQSSVLSWHGERVEAVVTDVSVAGSHRTKSYVFVLADGQGRPLPGRLREDFREFERGDRVTVVVDRGNWFDPRTTGEVAAARPLGVAAAIALAVTTLMAVLGSRRAGTGQPPRRGPGGLWIFNR